MRKIIFSTAQKEYIFNSYKSGINISEISNNLAITDDVLRNFLKKENVYENRLKIYSVNENYFNKIDSPDKAYWLGFLYADGYVRNRYGKYGELKLKLAIIDKDHVESFKNDICSSYPVKITGEKYVYKNIQRIASAATMSVYNNQIVNDLISHGCVPNKTLIIEFPKIDKEFYSDFIRGYFDGDGSMCFTSLNRFIFTITCGSNNFLSVIQEVFKDMGISKIYYRKVPNKNVYTLTICRIKDLKLIQKYFYDNNSIKFLSRKKEKFDNLNNY